MIKCRHSGNLCLHFATQIYGWDKSMEKIENRKLENRLKIPEYRATITAFFGGIFVHLFGLVNMLHNYDDIAVQPNGYGTGITSGRWFLTLFGNFIKDNIGSYNLSWLNGVIFIMLLAIAAGFFVSAFEIKNVKSAMLIGLAFVCFPAVTSTMFFSYTTPYYGLAILFSVMAAWVVEKYKWGLIPSVVLTAMSLGIYQAYVPITIGMFVLLLIKHTLKPDARIKELVCKGVYYCANLILGLLGYFVCLKILLALYGMQLSNYQGVGNMGQISLSELPQLIGRAYSSFGMLPISDYCSLAHTPVLKLAYILLYIVTVATVGYILIKKVKKMELTVFTFLLFAVFPLAVNFVVVMCPESTIYTLMVYSFVLILMVPLVVLEALSAEERRAVFGNVMSKAAGVLLTVVISLYAYYANVNYTSLYFANRQAENYCNSLVTQVRMTEGFDTEKEWAFIGRVKDPLLNNAWQEVPGYGGNATSEYLVSAYSWYRWIEYYMGYELPMASDDKIEQLRNSEEVQQMPCWPNAGSIKVMGDTVVIKFE